MMPFVTKMLAKVKEILFLLSSECTRQQVERSKEVNLVEADADLKFIGVLTKLPEWANESWESSQVREEAEWKQAKWTIKANREKSEWRNK